jgi:signal transduction histidine kinase
VIRRSDSRRLVAATAALTFGGAFTALAWLAPGFDVAYGGEGMHIAVDAIQATVGLVAGGFAWVRYTRTRRFGDLAAACAFGIVLVVESAFMLALPTLLNYDLLRAFSVWSSTGAIVLGAAIFLAAALLRDVRVSRPSAAALFVGGIVLFLALDSGLALHYEARLPLPIDPGLSPVAAGVHAFTGDDRVLATQFAVGAILIAVGAFQRRSPRQDAGPLLGVLGPALIIQGLAAINFGLFPSLYSYWVYSGDILTLAFCIVIAWGIVEESRAAARRVIDVAILEERRRLARDLHDGLAQELAFVAAEIADIPLDVHPSLAWIRSAVDRALFESRRAIVALTQPLDGSLALAVASAAQEITRRRGVGLSLRLDDTLELGAVAQEAILRVVREATTNAVCHAAPTTIQVTLARDTSDRARLVVVDDGAGFDVAAVAGGFGLTSMKERIERTGGMVRLESTKGVGTTVEAWWPACSTPRGRNEGARYDVMQPRADCANGSWIAGDGRLVTARAET